MKGEMLLELKLAAWRYPPVRDSNARRAPNAMKIPPVARSSRRTAEGRCNHRVSAL